MHGAAMAVDGRATYWASKLDPELPVEFSVSFGTVSEIQLAEIDWEYPPKSFAILVSEDGSRWEEVYTTDVNTMQKTQVTLGRRQAKNVKVVMREPHPVYGKLRGHSLFGINSLALFAQRSRIVVQECSQAAASTDARDKYFSIAVGSQEPSRAKNLNVKLQALDLAKASLSAATSTLFDLIPKLPLCGSTNMGLSAVAMAEKFAGISLHTASSRSAVKQSSISSGAELESASELLKSARAAILEVRSALK